MKTIQIPLKNFKEIQLTKQLRSLGLISFRWPDETTEKLTSEERQIKPVEGLTEQPLFTYSNNIKEVAHWWGGFDKGWSYFRLNVNEKAEEILEDKDDCGRILVN